ncbi:DUF397 domain-containing protein [Nocardia uniformis]|uniref:DUF397 domain-containing protein n=1 Tax=Nocardia uniformis TaxID=53432 RepID=A0A849CAB9_9NOCA|nr:DUF397 domain-containing protein [Nocardia uniformis]NNH73300.1 DUF397 domain-containing protein [Nocardia uniformis]
MKKPVKGVWYKSSRSDGASQCVEAYHGDSAVGVRDSKNAGGPALWFTPGEWDAFLSGAKRGEFDRP